ncbi:MAG TPA: HD domain-containing protein [Clostridiales bacterium]|nr:HD domain-containing protein [Clostridiales bacterium]
MFGKHLQEIRNLMEIKRYQNIFKHKKRSVSEHSWFVSKIAHGLALWERDKFKEHKVDMEKLLFFAINHDVVECYTGDIISTTKDFSETFRNELNNLEKFIFKNHIINTIPNSWGNMYIEMNKEMSELNNVESKIVEAADIIDRIFECMEEIDLKNMNPYEAILVRDINKLYKMNLKSVNYFLKYSINDLDGAKEYIPDNIKAELENIDFSPYF